MHKDGVIGIAIDEKQNQIYTIGNDKQFKATDIQTSTNHWETVVGTGKLTCMKYDSKRNRTIILNSIGEFFIYSTIDKAPKLVNKFSFGVRESFKNIILDNNGEYFLTCILIVTIGSTQGTISFINIAEPGKEKLIKEMTSFKGVKNSTCIELRPSRMEAIIGYESGKVIMWQTQNSNISGIVYYYPVAVFTAYDKEIVHLQWSENDQILYTTGLDKQPHTSLSNNKFTIWKFPEEWYSIIYQESDKLFPSLDIEEVKAGTIINTEDKKERDIDRKSVV